MCWPFRLLIAVVISFVTLMIIFSAIHYFEDLRIQVSEERLKKGLDAAWGAITTPDNPEKGINLEENLTLGAGTYGVIYYSERFGMDTDCIEMQALSRSNLRVNENKKAVTVDKITVSDVYFLCIRDPSNSACETECIISFGRPPEID